MGKWAGCTPWGLKGMWSSSWSLEASPSSSQQLCCKEMALDNLQFDLENNMFSSENESSQSICRRVYYGQFTWVIFMVSVCQLVGFRCFHCPFSLCFFARKLETHSTLHSTNLSGLGCVTPAAPQEYRVLCLHAMEQVGSSPGSNRLAFGDSLWRHLDT